MSPERCVSTTLSCQSLPRAVLKDAWCGSHANLGDWGHDGVTCGMWGRQKKETVLYKKGVHLVLDMLRLKKKSRKFLGFFF